MERSQQWIKDLDTLKAFAHPLRMRIIGALRLDGPATATELAERFGESTGSTSYHLRQLARYGFVVDDETQPSRRERRWRATHEMTSWSAADFLDEPAALDALGAIHQQQARGFVQLSQQYREELARGEWGREWANGATVSDLSVRLTPEASRELRDRIFALIGEYERRCAEADNAERVMIYLASFPYRRLPW